MQQTFDAPQRRPRRQRQRRARRSRDEARISPFDSVGPGRRRRLGGAAAPRRPDLPAHRAPRPAAALGAGAGVRGDPDRRGDHRAAPPHARGQRDARRRARPAHAHPRREDHQRHGPAAQPGRSDADRAGRVQVAGLRRRRHHARHLVGAPAPRRLARPEDPPQQPAQLDPRQDRGQRGRRRRRADARRRGLRRRDQRHPRVLRDRRRAAHLDDEGLPGGHHPRDDPPDLLDRGDSCRRRRPLAGAALHRRRGVRHRHHGRADAGGGDRRTPDRRRHARSADRAARGGVRGAHRPRGRRRRQ